MSTAALLTAYELCHRKGAYSREFEPNRLSAKEMTYRAICLALEAQEPQDGAFGEIAGSAVLQLAQDRGIESALPHIYGQVIHHAALADILVSTLRKAADPPWAVPPNVQSWTPGCFLAPDGNSLRRIVLVSHWTDARHYSECRSWFSLGEVCHYKMPMQLAVLIIGQERNGKRSSPFTTGFCHPMNKQLRFRKKSKAAMEVFNDKWAKILREDHAEISRETWLAAMLQDDVLPEVAFKVDIPVPEEVQRQRIVDMAARKLEQLYAITEKPQPNLSTCDFPVPCQFRGLCHTLPEREPSEKNGFILLGARETTVK